jgi:hypothetical protein
VFNCDLHILIVTILAVPQTVSIVTILAVPQTVSIVTILAVPQTVSFSQTFLKQIFTA